MKKSLIVLVLLVVNASYAGIVVSGVGVADYHSQSLSWATEWASNTVNGSGFDPIAGTHDNNVNNMWQAISSNDPIDWQPWITWDLGSVKKIDSMIVWNFNRDDSGAWYDKCWAVKYADVYISSDSDPLTASWTKLKNQQLFKLATGDNGYGTPDIVDMEDVDARLVKLVCTQTYMYLTGWGGKYDTGNGAGLSEVQFVEVPEPTTLFGLGMGVLLLFRRKK